MGDAFRSERHRVRAVWPIGDAIDGITVTIHARQQVGGGQSIRTENDMQPSGRVPLRCRGKQMQPTITHAAGSIWSYSQGFDLEFEAR
ncbi:hypothetical protein AB5I41_30925 [Sphingomonas sp. MMS24-JH45]